MAEDLRLHLSGLGGGRYQPIQAGDRRCSSIPHECPTQHRSSCGRPSPQPDAGAAAVRNTCALRNHITARLRRVHSPIRATRSPDVRPADVARRHGINTGLLYTWRRQMLEGSSVNGRFGCRARASTEHQIPSRVVARVVRRVGISHGGLISSMCGGGRAAIRRHRRALVPAGCPPLLRSDPDNSAPCRDW